MPINAEINPNRPILINLESLLDLSGRLNEIYDSFLILNLTLLSLMGKIKISRAIAFLADKNSNSYKVIINKTKLEIESLDYFEVNNLRKLDDSIKIEKLFLETGLKYFLPSLSKDKNIALFCLGNKIDGSELSEEERQYARLVSIIASNALQHADSDKKLIVEKNIVESRNQLLTTMFEMSRDFSVIRSRKQILKMLSYHLMGQIMVSRFAIFLKNNDGKFETLINRFEEQNNSLINSELFNIETLCCLDDVDIKEELKSYFEKTQAYFAVPMKIQGLMKGILVAAKKLTGEPLTEENKLFVEALGNTAIAALENERLFLQELEQKKLENELSLALEIQKKLMPKELPSIENYSIFGISIPSRHVGGDYYDVIKLDDERLLLTIADVSGKGMPASLLMANTQAALRVLAPLSLPLKEVINRLNSIIFQNTSSDKFVTLFLGILNYKTYKFHYINAGHNPPYLIDSNGNIKELTQGGLILGVLDNYLNYSEETIEIAKGDTIFFYTDGITEALNENNEEFNESRLKGILLENRFLNPREQIEKVIGEIRQFAGLALQSDDITALAVKHN